MKNALKIEILKTKSSNDLNIALILPLLFCVFTLMTLLSSRNPTGLVNGVSIIQTNIFNIWALILLPICVVMIISGDYQQEKRALGLQSVLANHWSLQQRYLAKSLKYWLLMLLAQTTLLVVVCISNLLTTRTVGNVALLSFASLVIWLGSWPLIVINMQLLRYLNAIMVILLNLGISIMSAFMGIALTLRFWLDPWVLALRTITLLRINPNGTVLSAQSNLTNNLSFIGWIVIVVVMWLIINYLLSLSNARKVA
ncbi:hypothetical protein [Fructilactobacillus carniphilus]|uniref:Lantibiotic ABC transporter permease n=1 Tax=Fructilactobacillus carniphilus TaxID=2940297 RepID=A0ABY5BUT0_9LACO|nr:hypothetical protein [Fructilactobacillus carniphilus]USS90259.1 hypothetical protein M3M37_05300 [Fructilactobacillus carniphilus]